MKTTLEIAWVLSALLFGCGAKTIHLDDPTPGQGGANAPPAGGSGGSSIDRGVPNASVVVDQQDLVLDISVDATRLYWYTSDTHLNGTGSSVVRSCAKVDCASSIVTYDTRPNDGMGGFMSLAVDKSNVYWVRDSEDHVGVSIFACPIAGCAGTPRLTRRITGRSFEHPIFSSLVSDGEHLYWTAPSETGIFRCAVASCADVAEAVALNQETLGALAVDATHIYWVANSGKANSAILRAPKDGSALPETVASAQNQAWALALDGNFVYWTNHYAIGTISRCPLTGCSGPPTVLVSNQNYPASLATDGNKVFWINSGGFDASSMTLLKCLADTCQSTFEVVGHPLISSSSSYSSLAYPSLAVDDTYVYWIFHGHGLESGGFPLAAVERVAK